MKKVLLFIIFLISIFFLSQNAYAESDFVVKEEICEYVGIAHKGVDVLGEVSTPTVSITPTGKDDTFILNVHLGDSDGLWTQTYMSSYMTKFYMDDAQYAAYNGKISYGSDSIRSTFVRKGVCPPYVVVSMGPAGDDKRLTVKAINFPAAPPSDCNSWVGAFDADYTFCSVSNYTDSDNMLQLSIADKYLLHSEECSTLLQSVDTLNIIYNEYWYLASKNANSTLMKIAQYKYYGDVAEDIYNKIQPDGACYTYRKSASDVAKNYFDWFDKYLPGIIKNVGKHDTSEDPKEYKNKCQYILGDPSEEGDFAYYLDMSFKFIKFAAPALLIVMSIIDYIKVIAASDADAMKKTNKKTITRIIFTLLIFVLPTLISMILSLLGLQGSCDFPNISGI